MGKRANNTETGRLPLALLVIAFAMISTAPVHGSSGQIETALDRYISAKILPIHTRWLANRPAKGCSRQSLWT